MNDFFKNNKTSIYAVLGIILAICIFAVYMSRTSNNFNSRPATKVDTDISEARHDSTDAGQHINNVNDRLSTAGNRIDNIQTGIGNVQTGIDASKERTDNITARTADQQALIRESRQLIREGLGIIQEAGKSADQPKNDIPDNNSVKHSGNNLSALK